MKINFFLNALLAIVGVVGAGFPLMAQELSEQRSDKNTKKIEAGKDVSLGKLFEIESKVLSEKRTFMVSVPRGYRNGTQRYPVVYVLDGRNNFLHTTATARFLAGNRKMADVIVIAINNTQRTRDLTPKTESGKDQERFPTGGGAENFNKFLQEELIPHIDKNYRTTGYRCLIGHSFGGLFVFHLLQTAPDAFNSYLAISPSLWWNDQKLLERVEEKLQKFPKHDCRLFMTLGNEKGKMIESIEKMNKLLSNKSPEQLKWKYLLLDDETHGSVPLRSTYHGLQFLFRGVKTKSNLSKSR